MKRFLCWLLGHPRPKSSHRLILPTWWTCERCGAEMLHGKEIVYK